MPSRCVLTGNQFGERDARGDRWRLCWLRRRHFAMLVTTGEHGDQQKNGKDKEGSPHHYPPIE